MLSINRVPPIFAAARMRAERSKMRHRFQRLGVADGDIIQKWKTPLRKAVVGISFAPHARSLPLRANSTAIREITLSRPAATTRRRVEIGVARGHRQTVRLAQDRAAEDLDGQDQIAHHAADNEQLLIVLLAEDRDVGLGRRSGASETTVATPRRRSADGNQFPVRRWGRRPRAWSQSHRDTSRATDGAKTGSRRACELGTIAFETRG